MACDPVDAVVIETPCEVPWESLTGDDRVRHCGRCSQNVYNLEAFSRADALRLIQARERRVCLRLYRRADGTVVTADCWSRLRAARRRGLVAFALAMVIVAWAQLWAMVVGLHGLRRLVGRRTMGAIPAVSRPPEHLMGAPPEVPVMGKPTDTPAGKRLMGKRAISRVSERQARD